MKSLSILLSLLVTSAIAMQFSTQQSKPPVGCDCCCSPDPCPCFQRGDDPLAGMPMMCEYPAAYNHPGNINVSACWDIYADASYLYWFAKEEGLEIALAAAVNHVTASTLQTTENSFLVLQDSKYSSGFKAGLGANLNIDDWVVDLEYTWLRQKTSVSKGPAPTVPTTLGSGVWSLAAWFYESYFAEGIVADTFDSKWKFDLDWLDLSFSRPYYQGRRLVITPSAGLRASWIRQRLTVSSPNAYSLYLQDASAASLNVSRNLSQSWAIGPRALVNAHWLVGSGFRFQGDVGASLLFTQFTKIAHFETGTSVRAAPLRFRNMSNYNCLRPMLEANLGVGWGTYFSQKQYHLDLAATYDFNYLWGQNMMRYAAEVNASVIAGGYPNDMFLHGLTVKARFDF